METISGTDIVLTILAEPDTQARRGTGTGACKGIVEVVIMMVIRCCQRRRGEIIQFDFLHQKRTRHDSHTVARTRRRSRNPSHRPQTESQQGQNPKENLCAVPNENSLHSNKKDGPRPGNKKRVNVGNKEHTGDARCLMIQ